MNVTIGKHKGKSVELLVLKAPDYIKWVIGNREAAGSLLAIKREAERLIDRFDEKPFTVHCLHCKNEVATRISLYRDSSDPFWWCDNCDPYSNGAVPGTLTVVNDYKQMLNHIENSCGGRKSDYQNVIKSIAQLKGLPKRVGETKANEFFN